MALKILAACTNCDMCLPECPNKAIRYTGKTYVINPDLCTECVGFYDTQTCKTVCPIDCIITDPEHQEDADTLMAKFEALVLSDQI